MTLYLVLLYDERDEGKKANTNVAAAAAASHTYEQRIEKWTQIALLRVKTDAMPFIMCLINDMQFVIVSNSN